MNNIIPMDIQRISERTETELFQKKITSTNPSGL